MAPQDQSNGPTADIPSEGSDGEGRRRSSISFPYIGLDDSEQTAYAIHTHVGSGVCEDDQLAAWLRLSPKSSGYRLRIAAARLFGLIESPHASRYRLSDLGKQIVDPQRQRSARVTAFLNVPLFYKMYEDHRGGVLPPPAAFERAMEIAGVAPKQKARARQILERSADYAGFFQQGKGRLVKPGIAASQSEQKPTAIGASAVTAPTMAGGGGGGGGGGGQLDPMLVGLINKLPRGPGWPLKERITWLKAATVIFELVYGYEDKEIDVAEATNGEAG